MTSVASKKPNTLSAVPNFGVILTHLHSLPNVTLLYLQKYECFHVGLEK